MVFFQVSLKRINVTGSFLASRKVLPDAGPCNNEVFVDLAFEGIQRAFGEAADV